MATKSLLSPKEKIEVRKLIQEGSLVKGDSGLRINSFLGSPLSQWLGKSLEDTFAQSSYWFESQPIFLGSWGRGELCPKSDIDLLFCGPEKIVKNFVDEQFEKGFKIRYRVPQDQEDWTVGVETFDVLSLLFGRSPQVGAQQKLDSQVEKIKSQKLSYRKALLNVISQERQERQDRFDSVANYLEPNIKYGPGGLRDILQALTVFELFKERFLDSQSVFQGLRHYQHFFLSLRQLNHLEGGDEVFLADLQKQLASYYDFPDIRLFMAELQKGFSQVFLDTEWVFERAKSGRQRVERLGHFAIRNIQEAFSFLHQNTSVLAQSKVRWILPKLKVKKDASYFKKCGQLMNRFYVISEQERFLVALFKSGLVEACIPEFKKIKGLVQHDQYHKFTVDAHIIQCVRELKRIHARPSVLGPLKKVFAELKERDFKILLWASLYHDLGKGRKGDHSQKGAKLVKDDFIAMKLSLSMTAEVAWLVEKHLVLSSAAFRRNPQTPATWQWLHKNGVVGKRLNRLAIFTAIDIRATNPEAWTGWKESLLFELIQTLKSPKARKYFQLLSQVLAHKLSIKSDFLRTLDPYLIESLPVKHLREDYQLLIKTKKPLELKIVSTTKDHYWLRFHRAKDEVGLFLKFVSQIYSVGADIQLSFVQTHSQFGVYDWFEIHTAKTRVQLKKLFQIIGQAPVDVPRVYFDRVELISRDSKETVLSFKGRNQRGAMLAAAYVLYVNDIKIRWARALNWGRQVEDIFAVESAPDMDEKLEVMRLQVTHQLDRESSN